MDIDLGGATPEEDRPTAAGCAGAAFLLLLGACIAVLAVAGTIKVLMGWFA